VPGKKQRQRRLARERYERNLSRRVQQQERARRFSAIALVCLVVVGLGIGGFFLFSGGSGSKPSAATTPRPSATTPAATPSAAATTPSASPSAAAPVAEPAHTCDYNVSGTASRKVSLPPKHPDFKAHYQATLHTNRGNIVIDLLNSKATCAVNSFVSLAAQKFFSQTSCHRLTTSGIFVLQCGDPTGTGTGGPGYQFGYENLSGAKYVAGTVAMAHSNAPNSNGSQFFLVYQDSTSLPSNYTPFGTIVSGLKIVQNVAKAGSDNANALGDGHPKEKVVIKSVTIKKT
jgi:peptidyl-prolyl cis-trans isomerase B (cyclophilin B)